MFSSKLNPTHKRSTLSESSFQKKILDWLKSQPQTYVFKVIRANRSGVHDIIVCHKGLFKIIEVKSDTGRMSDLQKLHAIEVRLAGGQAFNVKPSTFEVFKHDFHAN